MPARTGQNIPVQGNAQGIIARTFAHSHGTPQLVEAPSCARTTQRPMDNRIALPRAVAHAAGALWVIGRREAQRPEYYPHSYLQKWFVWGRFRTYSGGRQWTPQNGGNPHRCLRCGERLAAGGRGRCAAEGRQNGIRVHPAYTTQSTCMRVRSPQSARLPTQLPTNVGACVNRPPEARFGDSGGSEGLGFEVSEGLGPQICSPYPEASSEPSALHGNGR